MYYNPEVNNKGLDVIVYNDKGVLAEFAITNDMEKVTLGYGMDVDTFIPILNIIKGHTDLNLDRYDLDNLTLQINYKDSQNPNDFYKVKNKVTIKSISRTISYEVVKNPLLLSNTSLARYNYFMPKWSTAFKNNISNYSKIFYPIFEDIEKLLIKSQTSVRANIQNADLQRVKGYNKDISYVIVNNNKIVETSCKEKSEFNSTELTKVDSINSWSITQHDVLPISNKKETPYLYILNLEETQMEITIVGLDFNNSLIKESFQVPSKENRMTEYKYSKLLKIETSSNYTIKNHIDGIDLVSLKDEVKFSYFIDYNKNFANNIFQVRNDKKQTLVIEEYAQKMYDNPIRTFSTLLSENLNNPKVFLTTTGQVLVHNNNKLYTGVLREPLESFNGIHPSNNNNNIITILNDTQIVGDTCTFSVNTKELVKTSGELSCFLTLTVNDKIYYVDNNNNFTQEKVRYFINNTSKNILIDLKYESDSKYSLTLFSDTIILSASTYSNSIKLSLLSSNISLIYGNKEKIYVFKENQWYLLKLKQNYYENDTDRQLLFLPKEYDKVEVVYTDGTREKL